MHSGKFMPKRLTMPKSVDLHICGTCNQNFNDLTQFIEHKKKLCSEILTVVVTTASNTEESQREHSHAFHINVDEGKSGQMESNHEHRRQSVLHSLPLTENTKTISIVKTEPIRHDTASDKVVHTPHRPRKQYHSIMADEDVAAILANQLSNEVISLPAKDSADQDGSSNESVVLVYHQDDTPLALQEIVISQEEDEDDYIEETEPACEDYETPNGDALSLTPKKRHECVERNCNFSTTYLKDLVRHTRTHTGERPYICTICSRSFSRSDKLQQHQRIHIGIKPHRCHLCDYSAIDGGSLKKHIRMHNNERPFKCQMCTYCARDTSQLTVHLRRHTGDQPFVCSYESCTSAFKTSSDLKRHMRRHTGEKPYGCSQCEYACSIKSNLAVHIRINHEAALKRPGCKKCDFIATNRVEARNHAKLHSAEVLQCGLCEFTSVNATTMRNHLKTHAGVKSVSCKFCPYTCWNLCSLKRHLRAKHTEYSSAAADDGKTSDVKLSDFKSHQCPCCNVAFVREDSWRSHVRQHAAGIKHALPPEYIVAEPVAAYDLEDGVPSTGRLDADAPAGEATSQQILDGSSLQANTMYLYVQSDGSTENRDSTGPILLANQVHFVTLPGERGAASRPSAECVVLGRHMPGVGERYRNESGDSVVTRVSSQEKSSTANNSVIKRF